MTDSIMTTLLWTIAIIHCLSSRVIAPFLQALYVEFTTPNSTNIPAPLAVVVADVPAPARPTVKQARRKRASAKTAA